MKNNKKIILKNSVRYLLDLIMEYLKHEILKRNFISYTLTINIVQKITEKKVLINYCLRDKINLCIIAVGTVNKGSLKFIFIFAYVKMVINISLAA